MHATQKTGAAGPPKPLASVMPGNVASAAAARGRLGMLLLALPGNAIDLAVYSLSCATLEGYADYVGRVARAHEAER